MIEQIYDIAIIGGGVNGCGIARDAAGRGLNVLLAEQRDLAIGTSSASTKLIHGGLRYLEHYEFGLVRESLKEREVLLSMVPHIAWPLRFVLPHHSGLRPAWLIRLGLFLYDHLGGRKILPGSRTLDLRKDDAGRPLRDSFTKAFEYSDCWVDDARLVALNAVDAADRGADILTRTSVTGAKREGGVWAVTLHDETTGTDRTIRAKALVNAAGPWVAEVLSRSIGVNSKASVRLVKGSHIVIPRKYDHDRAYIFQNADGRIIFAIPYEQDFTLIGTTDVDFTEDPKDVRISDGEIAYLCEAASAYFADPIHPDDVVWTYSGVRPLYDDGASAAQTATRDFVLDLHARAGEAALLNIFGGKITTYRHLAEEALAKLKPYLPEMGRTWTAGAALPGGDFPVGSHPALIDGLRDTYPFLAPKTAARLVHAYGTRAASVLGDATSLEDLGQHFGADLYAREVAYLMAEEWAVDGDDLLWRRSKLGLRLTEEERRGVSDWMKNHRAATV
ncbi:glycerol-3-phosphate dehydrogenase [Hwanghaeella grinnelliae]|uniref:Glycerol-3-phosphate dehydrogenase n=1 Tax=Hwanghaeella grinnelliae TaxID=2500179 RepID=A0A3S2Y3E6_9PROT|nr:glycerol-3-phosphate dehydrogenase [Hwanghaeella grinnelliae]